MRVAKSGPAIAVVQFLRTLTCRPPRLETQEALDFVASHAIAALVGPTTGCVFDAGTRNSLRNDVGKLADLVIFFCVSDVEGLIADNILGCIKHCQRGPDDVADVHNRTPRRTVALDINTSSCVRGSYEVVKHEIETQ